MRSGDPDWMASNGPQPGMWNLGRPLDLAWPSVGTGTPFSQFRFAIPERMGFQGRAVYFDADMLVLGDVAELLTLPIGNGYTCIHPRRTDVSVIDCGWFADKAWWPKIADVQQKAWRVFEFCMLLNRHGAISTTLTPAWNDFDGAGWTSAPDRVKLIHYTDVMRAQAYCPYPKVRYTVPFPHCKYPNAGLLWWHEYAEALGAAGRDRLAANIRRCHVRVHGSEPDAGVVDSRIASIESFAAAAGSGRG